MANTKSAAKRAVQAEAHRKHNVTQRSAMRSAVKKCLTAIRSGEKPASNDSFKEAASLLDRYAGRGLIHANKAARLKSRLSKRIKAIA